MLKNGSFSMAIAIGFSDAKLGGMSTLKTYLDQERGNSGRLARQIGVSSSFLTQVATGQRPCPPKVAVRIETALDGRIKRQDLLPDWRDIWPELATAPAANDPHSAQVAEQGAGHA